MHFVPIHCCRWITYDNIFTSYGLVKSDPLKWTLRCQNLYRSIGSAHTHANLNFYLIYGLTCDFGTKSNNLIYFWTCILFMAFAFRRCQYLNVVFIKTNVPIFRPHWIDHFLSMSWTKHFKVAVYTYHRNRKTI